MNTEATDLSQNEQSRSNWFDRLLTGFMRLFGTLLILSVLALLAAYLWDAVANKNALDSFLGTFGPSAQAQTTPTPAGTGATAATATLTTTRDAIDGVFGVLQFALAAISGLIIVFGVGFAWMFGRSQSEQAAKLNDELKRILEAQKQIVSQSVEDELRKHTNGEASEALIAGYQSKLKQFEDLASRIEPLVGRVGDSREELEALDTGIDRVEVMYALREALDRKADSAPSVPVISNEERDELERTARYILSTIHSAERRRITGTQAFNAAQEAARKNMSEYAHRLAAYAFFLEPTPVHEIRLRRSEFSRGDRFEPEFIDLPGSDEAIVKLKSANPRNDLQVAERIREQARRQAMDMLEKVPLFNAHIVLGEAWNIAVTSESLAELIVALERAIGEVDADETRYMPAHAHVILAQAYAKEGDRNWRENTFRHLQVCLEKLERESPDASWYPHTVSDCVRLAQKVRFDYQQFVERGQIMGLSPDQDDALRNDQLMRLLEQSIASGGMPRQAGSAVTSENESRKIDVETYARRLNDGENPVGVISELLQEGFSRQEVMAFLVSGGVDPDAAGSLIDAAMAPGGEQSS